MSVELKTIKAEEYHADHSHVSNSMLKAFTKSRREYHGLYVAHSMESKFATKAMDTGTVAHAAILEPQIIEGVCLEIPKDALNKDGHRKGKAWGEFKAENDAKILLTAKELTAVKTMHDSVYGNEFARRLLSAGGQTEASIFWQCAETGLLRKCRTDYLRDGWVIDIKTSNDISPKWFSKYAADFGYHRQCAYYKDAAEELQGERPKFVLIAVQSTQPHTCVLYTFCEEAELLGKAENTKALIQLGECMASGDWREPGEKQITELDLPRWAYTSSFLLED